MVEATKQLQDFALSYDGEGITVHRAITALDTSLDGEEVVRMTLLLNDPASETWDFDQVRALHDALRSEAARLGLPWVSIRMIPQSEAEVVEAFAR